MYTLSNQKLKDLKRFYSQNPLHPKSRPSQPYHAGLVPRLLFGLCSKVIFLVMLFSPLKRAPTPHFLLSILPTSFPGCLLLSSVLENILIFVFYLSFQECKFLRVEFSFVH